MAIRDSAAGSSRNVTSFRRVQEGALVTVAPELDFVAIHGLAWHEDRALAFDDYGNTLLRFLPETGWEEISVDGCEPDAESQLGDAPAMDDAWILAQPVLGDTLTTLCHFDGASFTRVESVDGLRELVAFEDRLFAIIGALTVDLAVMVRSIDGGSWTRVAGLPAGFTPFDLLVRPDGVFVELRQEDLTTEWWRVDGAAAQHLGGLPGFGSEVWRVDREISGARTSCIDVGSIHHCSSSADLIAFRVLRVEADAPVEVGYLHLDGASLYDARFSEFGAHVIGPDQLLLISLGSVWMTDPARAP